MISPGDYLPSDGTTAQPHAPLPASQPVNGAQVSRYSPACGHRISRYEVYQDAAAEAETEPAALLICPVCRLVCYRIPASSFRDVQQVPLVVG